MIACEGCKDNPICDFCVHFNFYETKCNLTGEECLPHDVACDDYHCSIEYLRGIDGNILDI